MCPIITGSWLLHLFGPPVLGMVLGYLALTGLRHAGRARRAAHQAYLESVASATVDELGFGERDRSLGGMSGGAPG